MNIEKLVAAAKEIDRISILQEEKTKRYQELARQSKEAHENGDQAKIRKVQDESRQLSITVIDFGNAINDLRKALKARK